MKTNDPILETEQIVRKIHDSAGKYTQPVLHRYPLLFSFLVFFGVAAALDGFEILTEQMDIFQKHPAYLISIGLLVLFLTGMLYKSLGKKQD
jgi:hypothetical protein